MKKRFAVLLFSLFCIPFLLGCEATDYKEWTNSENATDLDENGIIEEADYKLWEKFSVWRDTDEAMDYTNDRKITFADYSFYVSYKEWKNSNTALDLDGDRKITSSDYDIYLNPTKTNFISWANSENAVDLNNDRIIDENDYTIAKPYAEFIGTFYIDNFVFSGCSPYFLNSGFSLSDFELYLPDIRFCVDKYGQMTWRIPVAMQSALGTDLATTNSAVSNAIIERLSDKLARIVVAIPRENVTFTLYLTNKTSDKGYTTTLSYVYRGYNGNAFFDIIYE